MWANGQKPSHGQQLSFMSAGPMGVQDHLDQLEEDRKVHKGKPKAPDSPSADSRPATRLPSTTKGVHSPPRESAVPSRIARDGTNGSLWLPHETVTKDRCKANIACVALFAGVIVWIVGIMGSARDRKDNPPVRIHQKVEQFGFPDIAICPTAGGGCDDEDPLLCLEGMQIFVSGLVGFEDDPYQVTTATTTAAAAVATPAPTAPATAAATSAAAASNTTNRMLMQPTVTVMDTIAHSWCPVVPLSELTIDSSSSGGADVQSLHASVYVLWTDEVSETPVSSTRQFINTFLLSGDDGGVSGDGDIAEGAVLSRLPYDRVSINGTTPLTFISNDVTVGLTEYVSLQGGEDSERVYTQASTTGQQTLTLEDADAFTGAILFATFSINNFSFQSIEEYNTVDYWTVMGAGGGILVIVYTLFGLFFVPSGSPGPRRVWRFSRRRKRRRSVLLSRANPPGGDDTSNPGSRRSSI